MAAPAAQAALTPVIVYLTDQPFQAEGAARQGQFQAQAAQAAARVAAQAMPVPLPTGRALTEAEEEAAAAAGAAAVDQAALAQALADYDTLMADQRRAVFQAAQPAAAASQAPVEALIVQLGGQVTARLTVVNALGARVPATALPILRQHPNVAEVAPDSLATGALETSPASMRAESFWNAGYTGGVLDLAVVDTGVDITHPAFAGHNFLQGRFLATADLNSNGAVDPSPDDLHGHGTHVAGITGSTAVGRRGVAYGFDTLLNAKAGWDTNGPASGGGSAMYVTDSMDAIEWALFEAAQPAEVINLSFAACTTDEDHSWARFFDAFVNATGVVAVVAAGNSGNGCTKITSPAIAANVIAVANMNDNSTSNRADDSLNFDGNEGPTAAGRRKPDLAAPGTFINSANAAWEGAGADYQFMTGTSMAAPHVAGAAVLLMQAGVTDPRAIKALLINTAEDYGPAGWDKDHGWGYVDLEQAFIHRGDVHLSSVSNATPYRLFKGPALAGDTATLTWHRHVAYPCATSSCTTTTPISNLNLFMYRASDNALLTSDVTAVISETVEQVKAPSNSPLNVVRVSLVSMDGALSEEPFALVTEEGFTLAAGPALADQSSGSVGPVGQPRPITIRVANPGDLPAHNVVVTVTVPANVGLTPGPQVVNVGFLDAGAVHSLTLTPTLQVDAPRFFGVAATGTGYGSGLSLTDSVGVYPEHSRQWVPYWVLVP